MLDYTELTLEAFSSPFPRLLGLQTLACTTLHSPLTSLTTFDGISVVDNNTDGTNFDLILTIINFPIKMKVILTYTNCTMSTAS